jgi:hypothetical protein
MTIIITAGERDRESLRKMALLLDRKLTSSSSARCALLERETSPPSSPEFAGFHHCEKSHNLRQEITSEMIM